jgi:hypothetical protein
VTNEGGNVQLLCKATGVPEPRFEKDTNYNFINTHHDPVSQILAFSGDEKMEKTL